MADSGIGVAGRTFEPGLCDQGGSRDRGVGVGYSISIVCKGIEGDVEREVNSTVRGCSASGTRDRDRDGRGCRGGQRLCGY